MITIISPSTRRATSRLVAAAAAAVGEAENSDADIVSRDRRKRTERR